MLRSADVAAVIDVGADVESAAAADTTFAAAAETINAFAAFGSTPAVSMCSIFVALRLRSTGNHVVAYSKHDTA